MHSNNDDQNKSNSDNNIKNNDIQTKDTKTNDNLSNEHLDKQTIKHNFLKLRSNNRRLKRKLKQNKAKQKVLKENSFKKTHLNLAFKLAYTIGSLLPITFFLFISFFISKIVFNAGPFYQIYIFEILVTIFIVDLALWYLRSKIKSLNNNSKSFGTKIVIIDKIVKPEINGEFIINLIFFTILFLGVFLFALPIQYFISIQIIQLIMLLILPLDMTSTLFSANLKVYQIKDTQNYAILFKNNWGNEVSKQNINENADEDEIQVIPFLPKDDNSKFNLIK